MGVDANQRWGRGLVLGVPMLWLLVFFLLPLGIIVKIALSQSALSIPPYVPVFELADGLTRWLEKMRQFSAAAFVGLFDDAIFWASCLSSVWIAGVSTLIMLVIAYPFALAIAQSSQRWRGPLLLLAMAPFWTSFLIRVYAWIMILKDEGLLNHALIKLGVIASPMPIFASDTAVVIGIVYSYLPFMILPLYSAIENQDGALVEAAKDLGASPFGAFWTVTLPLSRPGIIAGCLLVFIPALGEFVIPDLLGGSDNLMIGRTLWNEFFANRDWPAASAATILLLVMLVLPLALFQRIYMRRQERLA